MNERYMTASRTENFLKHGLPATLALGGIAAIGVNYSASTPDCEPATKQVTVQTGDTLWRIANTHVPDADTRDSIHAIAQNNPNSLDDAGKIHPGDTLSIDVCLPDDKAK
jgi:LysM repeat protein